MDYDKPPAWARNWCFLYMIGAVLTALSAVTTLLLLVTSYESFSKTKGGASLAFLYVLIFSVQSVTAMVNFWVCRSALK